MCLYCSLNKRFIISASLDFSLDIKHKIIKIASYTTEFLNDVTKGFEEKSKVWDKSTSTYCMESQRARLGELQTGVSTGERSKLRGREAIVLPLPERPLLWP